MNNYMRSVSGCVKSCSLEKRMRKKYLRKPQCVKAEKMPMEIHTARMCLSAAEPDVRLPEAPGSERDWKKRSKRTDCPMKSVLLRQVVSACVR